MKPESRTSDGEKAVALCTVVPSKGLTCSQASVATLVAHLKALATRPLRPLKLLHPQCVQSLNSAAAPRPNM